MVAAVGCEFLRPRSHPEIENKRITANEAMKKRMAQGPCEQRKALANFERDLCPESLLGV